MKQNHFITSLSGVNMPKIIYGTAWKKERTTSLVVEAVKSGYRGIDTACQPKHYQEKLVGDALSQIYKDCPEILRKDLFLQTKFTPLSGQDPLNIPYDKDAILETQVQQSIEKSLLNLQTEYIDSLLLHSPLKNLEETMKVWKVLETYHLKGVLKQIGISNIYSKKLLEMVWNSSNVKPAVIQNRFYSDSNYDKEIRQFCKANGVFYQSFWTLTGNPHILDDAKVKKLAVEKKCTVEQLFFKFVMQLGIIPLTGTKSKEHMKDDLDVLEMKELSNEEMGLFMKFIE